MQFEDLMWMRFLVKRMPGMFHTDDPEHEAPRLLGIALGAFKLGLSIGGGRMDLEDWFRARSIEYYRNKGEQTNG